MDYEYKTTFWHDFTIAESFGEDAITDTAERAFEEWKSDIVYLTELIMVLNHKCWYWYQKGNDDLTQTYEELYYKYDELAYNYLETNNPDGLTYYYRTLD